MGAYHFLICLLPPLPSALGEPLPLSFSEISRTVRRHIEPSDEGLLRAHLSVIDTANWESLEQGREPFLEGGMLSRAEMAARQNLPDFIRVFLEEKDRGIRRFHVHDRLWDLCYRALLARAEESGCRYLMDYVPWEIELRNRLTALRLRESGRNAEDHAIPSGMPSMDFTALLSPLEGQKNPLEAERYLDGKRLQHIYHCEGSDPFSLDALLAFLSRAMIYDRWARMQAPYDLNTFFIRRRLNVGDLSKGRIIAVNGPLATCEVPQGQEVLQNEVAYVHCQGVPLKAEVIRIRGRQIDMQVFESTTGMVAGDEVHFSGALLSATLGPGILGKIYDGLQNPLTQLENVQDFFLKRGQYLAALDEEKQWMFTPSVTAGALVKAGQFLGSVPEGLFQHHITVPLRLQGTWEVARIMPPGAYRVSETIAILTDTQGGQEVAVTLKQEWPVKMPVRAYEERLLPNRQMLTQCRLIDIFFPLAEGGTACIPGPFGAGKTVLQQIISRYAEADVVIIVACGERAGEVVETIREFPELEDPKTGGSLMNRTVIICNTSSMPVAAREASIYTGITIGEYYRSLGLKVLILADSTSRWAQALRESSARLEEIPGEEAFPAYLESRIAAVYERAGLVRLHDGGTGSLTLIGTVSPAGGNFEEPVTQNTLKVVGAFYGLSRTRSDQRRYPAIDPLISWSLYLQQMRASLEERCEGWVKLVEEVHRLLYAGGDVHQMMLVVGEEGISLDDLVTYLKAEIVDAVCLQQDSFDAVDRASSRERQIADFLLLMDMVHHAFTFASKDEARRDMTALHNDFFQMKYCPYDGDTYHKYRSEIESILAGRGVNC